MKVGGKLYVHLLHARFGSMETDCANSKSKLKTPLTRYLDKAFSLAYIIIELT